ncbi:hypothetical protein DFH09DRAFT_1085820 [Mycena vulgaris]|nr:hypothetical protein DFH09DRAFT_1085820 [Mycena vulgaris]
MWFELEPCCCCFRRAIYDFGPFIADYPEQVMLAGIVQNWCAKCTALSTDLDGDLAGRRTQTLTDELLAAFEDKDIIPFTREFPRADIHKMLSSDLLYQIIKGSFKDHSSHGWGSTFILNLRRMLLTNQRLDKLAAAQANLVEHVMVPPTFVPVPDKEVEDEEAEPVDEPRVEGNVILARRREHSYPRFAEDLAVHINFPEFPLLLASFLDDQLHSVKYSDDSDDSSASLGLSDYPISV